MNVEELVTIESFEFLQGAEAAKDFLEDQGMTVFLMDKNTIYMNWALGNAIGYVKLQVPASQAERAHSLLQERKANHEKRREVRHETDEMVCLACDAEIPSDQQKCPSCGWSYARDDKVDANLGADFAADIDAESPEAEIKEIAEDEDDEQDQDDQASSMDRLKGMKRTVFLIILSPMILGAAFLIIAVFIWVLWLVGSLASGASESLG